MSLFLANGTNKNIKKLLKKYDKMIKKKISRITIMFDTINRTGAVYARETIVNENKDLIRECLIDHNWKRLTDSSTTHQCPIHGGKELIDYSGREYKYLFMSVDNSLNISYFMK